MTKLPTIIQQRLAEYAARRRQVLLCQGAGETVAAFLGGLLLVMAVDGLLRPDNGVIRFLAYGVYVLSGGLFCWRVLLRGFCGMSTLELAKEVEKRLEGRLEERLRSAVELTMAPQPGVSDWMIGRTVALAAQDIGGLDTAGLVPAGGARRIWSGILLPLMLMAGIAATGTWRDYLWRALLPGGDIPRPSRIQLEIEPGDCRLAAGAGMSISVRAQPVPEKAAVHLIWHDGLREKFALDEVNGRPGQFLRRLPALRQGMAYRVLAGDAESRLYRVEVQAPPELEQISLTITPPAYVNQPARTQEGGDAEALSGSTIGLCASLKGGGKRAGLVSSTGNEIALALQNGRVQGSWIATESQRYRLRVVDDKGGSCDSVREWQLRVRADRKPTVELDVGSLSGGLIGLNEGAGLKAEAADDLGLTGLRLLLRAGGQERLLQEITLAGSGCQRVERQLMFYPQATRLQEGDHAQLVLSAVDTGGQTVVSKPVDFTLVNGAPAGLAAQAQVLRSATALLRESVVMLEHEKQRWENMQTQYKDENNEAKLVEALVAVKRIASMQTNVKNARERVWNATANLPQPLDEAGGVLADALERWSRIQAGVLWNNCHTMTQDSGRPSCRLLRDLAESGENSLRGVGREVSVLCARVEAEGLVQQSEAALRRQQRTRQLLALLQATQTEPGGWQPGLLQTFYRSLDCSGEAVYVRSGMLRLENYDVPGIGRSNWSVRCMGEVLIPVEGDYEFRCRADDGVRLKIAGKSLIPATAWVEQAPTPYGGILHLSAGWQPVEIEMYQGAGGSYLDFCFSSAGRQPELATAGQLRHQGTLQDAEFRKQLGRLPETSQTTKASDADGAVLAERLEYDLSILAGVAAALERMSADTELPDLARLAQEARDPAAELMKILRAARSGPINADRSGQVDGCANALASLSRQAKDILERQLPQIIQQRKASPGQTGMLAEAANNLREQLWKIPEQGKGLPEEERKLLRDAARQALIAQTRQLVGQIKQSETALRAGAADWQADLAQRQQEFMARERLLRDLPGLENRADALASVADGDTALQNQELNALLEQSERVLREAQNSEKRSLDENAAAMARDMYADAESSKPELGRKVQELRNAQRVAGQPEQARRLAQALERPGQSLSALRQVLAQQGRPAEVQQWRVGNDLQTAAKTAAEGKTDLPQLDLLAQKMDLIAGVSAQRINARESAAYRQLQADLQAVMVAPEAERAPALLKLAERVDALENRRGAQARDSVLEKAQQEQQQASQKDPGLAQAGRLLALAELAQKAVGDAGARVAFHAQLQQLLAGEKEKALGIDRVNETATQRLRELGGALDQAEQLRRAEFASFIRTQEELRQDFHLLQKIAQNVVEQNKEGAVHAGVQEVSAALPKAEQAVNALAESARDAASVADAPARQREMADAARQQAQRLQREGLEPLVAGLLRTKPAEPMKADAVALAQRLSAALSRQRAAAESISGSAEQTAKLHRALEQALREEGAAGDLSKLSASQLVQKAEVLAGKSQDGEIAGRNAGADAFPVLSPQQQAAAVAGKLLRGMQVNPAHNQTYQQAAQQLAQAAGEMMASSAAAASATMQSFAPAGSQSGGNGATSAASGKQAGTDSPVAGRAMAEAMHVSADADSSGWAKAKGELDQEIRSGGNERFGEEYSEPIRAYFRRLAEEKK